MTLGPFPLSFSLLTVDSTKISPLIFSSPGWKRFFTFLVHQRPSPAALGGPALQAWAHSSLSPTSRARSGCGHPDVVSEAVERVRSPFPRAAGWRSRYEALYGPAGVCCKAGCCGEALRAALVCTGHGAGAQGHPCCGRDLAAAEINLQLRAQAIGGTDGRCSLPRARENVTAEGKGARGGAGIVSSLGAAGRQGRADMWREVLPNAWWDLLGSGRRDPGWAPGAGGDREPGRGTGSPGSDSRQPSSPQCGGGVHRLSHDLCRSQPVPWLLGQPCFVSRAGGVLLPRYLVSQLCSPPPGCKCTDIFLPVA